MQIIPAVSFAADGVQPFSMDMGQQSPGGNAFEMVMAANRDSLMSMRPAALRPADAQAPLAESGALSTLLPGLIPSLRPEPEPEPESLAIPQPVEEHEQAETLDPLSLAALAMVASPQENPLNIPDDASTDTLSQISDLTQEIAHILEGNTPHKDIDDLMAQLDELLARLDPPLEQQPSPLAREIMARMPEINAQREPEALPAVPQDGSCPLENVSEGVSQTLSKGAEQTAQPATTLVASDKNQAAPAQPAPAPVAGEAPIEQPRGGQQMGGQPEQQMSQGEQAPQAPQQAPVAPQRAEPMRAETEQPAETAKGEVPEAPEAPAEAMLAAKPLDIGALRAQGEVQMQQPQTVTATRETLFDTMVQEMTLEHSAERSTLEIQLMPEHLGKVTIQLTLQSGVMSARVQADDPSVRSLIGSQINQLVAALGDKGIQLSQVDVTQHNPQAQNFNFQQSSGGREEMEQEHQDRTQAARALGGIDRRAFSAELMAELLAAQAEDAAL